MKHLIIFLALTLNALLTYSQCKDSIYEKFGTTLPTQGGTWVNNSVIYGDSIKCPGLSCSKTPQYYIQFDGLGDYLRTPLINQNAKFYFSYKRSNNNTGHRIIVETSPDNTTWTTRLNLVGLTTTYKDTNLLINNVYVRIRDQRDSTTSTRVWYLDDVKWVWEANVGVWTGGYSSDWTDARNWCKGQAPTSTDNVLIPTGTPFTCILPTNQVGFCNNITINNLASLKILGTLKIKGQITSSQNLDVRSGNLEFIGTISQNFQPSSILQNTINNLIISNPVGVSIIGTNDTLKLKNSLTFGTTNSTLTTNGNLTLLSSDTLTARIGDLTGNHISGNVIVERYIPNHTKAWQLLAVPTKGQTINSTWQEGNTPLGNTKPGRGILLTGPFTGADISSSLPSIKTYNSTTNLWDGITSTSSLINSNKGYMTFVRGDRSVTTISQPATSTILRTTGTLYTPDAPPPTINVSADKFECVNNFYTSPINFQSLTRTGGVQNTYYVWDPKLTNSSVSTYGYGAYQTFIWNGSGYNVVPGGGSYTNGNTNIESGIAFFVKSFGTDGTLSFNESAKTTGGNLVTRVTRTTSLQVNLSAVINEEPILIDGVISNFDRMYSINVDFQDVKKFTTTEGLGLFRDGQLLSGEFRQMVKMDTLQLQLIRPRIQKYQLTFIPNNMEGISIYLFDAFYETLTPVSNRDISNYLYQVGSSPLSSLTNRFSIVLKRQ